MKKKAKKEKDLFKQIESFLQSKSKWIIILSLILSFIISMLLFNHDVSTGGDDSGYIKFAYDFAKGKAYPAWHSPFYSIMLSLFIMVFGVNIFILKFTSILFNLGAIYLTYLFLKKYLNHTVATFVTLISSLNYLICYYSSTTYSESFFFLLLIIFMYYFIELVQKSNNSKDSFLKYWKQFVFLGILGYLLFLTKTVAFAVIGVTLLYLIIEKQYLNSALYISSTAVFHFVITFLKRIIWDSKKVGFEDQLEALRLKDPYKPQLGNEQFMGFIHRFWDNSQLYLSKHFMKMIGIFPNDYNKVNLVLTILIYTLLIGSAVFLIIKNKKLLHVILSVFGMIAITFIILQKIWDQDRLIMIYFPYLIGIIFFALFLLFETPKLKRFQFVVILLMGTVLVLNGNRSIEQIQKKEKEKHYSTGEFGSYTPDWQNYMIASKWAGKNLSSNSVVVCRKPEMSWIASSGKNIFNGIYRVEYQNADSVYNMIVEKKATHAILENFRLNPKKKTERTITTMRNVLSYLVAKNPGCLKLLKEFGNDEKAYVYEIHLNEPRNTEQYFQNIDNALIVNPKNINIYIEKARYIKSKKGIDEAIKVYDQAMTLLPEEPYLYFNRGLLFFEKSQYKEALSDFKKTTDYKADFNQSWYNQAICYFYLGDYQDSRIMLEKAKTTGMKNYQQFEQMLSRYH